MYDHDDIGAPLVGGFSSGGLFHVEIYGLSSRAPTTGATLRHVLNYWVSADENVHENLHVRRGAQCQEDTRRQLGEHLTRNKM